MSDDSLTVTCVAVRWTDEPESGSQVMAWAMFAHAFKSSLVKKPVIWTSIVNMPAGSYVRTTRATTCTASYEGMLFHALQHTLLSPRQPTCVEGPPGPPDEGQRALVKDWVQNVRGVPVGVCPEHGLAEGGLGTLHPTPPWF